MSTPSLKKSLSDLTQELGVTRRVLERIPEDNLTWKPHPKSMTIGGLGQHIANLGYWMVTTLEQPEYDLASGPSVLGEPASREEILERFDTNAAAVQKAFDAVDDEALRQQWVLRHGDNVIMKQSRVGVLRSACISHLIHHRGQLSVYLRLLDIPVPSIYGPSADES